VDVPTAFFSRLRGLALTLEKEVKQLMQALRGEDADSEDESPVRVLHDLHCEVKTLKEAVNASLGTSCSKNQAVHDFMKASELLMQRNAADLGKLRELFQKYGYKPQVKDSTASVQNKSDEEKAKDVLHLPTSTEKPPLPKNPLCNPQLADFGLSQYAFSRPWSAVKTQHTTNARQQKSKNETPLRVQTPRTLPKTPKCRLKMDDYECVTPKLEHFGISEHTMCMNEDYTMSLMHRTAQTMKNWLVLCLYSILYMSFHLAVANAARKYILYAPSLECATIRIFHTKCIYKGKMDSIISDLLLSLTVGSDLGSHKKADNGRNVPEITPRRTMVSSVSKSNVRAKNADWMASPMGLMFCTPDVKVSSKANSKVLPRSPETKELPLPSHTVTPPLPDFQTRWLKPEAKVANSSYVCFHTLCHKQHLIPLLQQQVKLGGKTESVTKNGAKDKQYREGIIPFAVSPDEYLKHLGDPSPPTIKHYDQLLDTPPPPEITRIPDDVLQILSKYNHKIDYSKATEMETKAGSTTRYESDSTDYHNKENRYDGILQ
ncbi:SKA3 protein, partial [Scytalopus superciliaris]|nr:SKA3 protein [Scytalopus superciliaris]